MSYQTESILTVRAVGNFPAGNMGHIRTERHQHLTVTGVLSLRDGRLWVGDSPLADIVAQHGEDCSMLAIIINAEGGWEKRKP